MILYAALLFIGSLGGYFLGYHRGLARGRIETSEAITARLAEYGVTAPVEGDGVGWQ